MASKNPTTQTKALAKVVTADTLPTAAPVVVKVRSYQLQQSDETFALAVELADFIKQNNLSMVIQGRDYVLTEGWQYAGSRLGIVPIVEHVLNVGSEAELKYQAKVTLWDLRSQHTVGAGFATCSNKESGKKFYQEFAIMSMAQTRAVGKAYRNLLAWIIRAAGYEPTPAEEMDYNTNGNAAHPTTGSSEPANSAPPAASAGSAPSSAEALTVARDEDAPKPVQWATASQKEEIIRLLNHPVVTRPEKTKMLLNINRLDEQRAVQAVAKLRKAITDRENGLTDYRATLRQMLADHGEQLQQTDVLHLGDVTEDTNSTAADLRDALFNLRDLVAALAPAA